MAQGKSLQQLQFQQLDPTIQNLLREAVEARNFSYSPYSKFPVGASILCEDGTIIRGCNVENASYSPSICAERTAYVKAISEGKRNFKAVAVIAYQEHRVTTPCGYCRQFMGEFGNCPVYMSKPDLKLVYISSVEELIPFQFDGNELISQ